MIRPLLFLLLLPFFMAAQDFPKSPDNYVTDHANLLSPSQQQDLNSKLAAYEKQTSSQIFIYLTNSLNGRDMSRLCQDIFHTWKIGSEKNNGVLIAVFAADHKYRIHTGYGMEGVLPDLKSKRIQAEIMRPQFKAGDYYAGISAGVDAIITAAGSEYAAEDKTAEKVAEKAAEKATNKAADKSEEKSDYSMLFAFAVNATLLIAVIMLSRDNPSRKGYIIVSSLFTLMPVIGAFVLFLMLIALLGKPQNRYYWQNRYYRRRRYRNGFGQPDYYESSSNTWSGSSSSDSSSDSSGSESRFSGGGGGDSGGSGSDDKW